MRTSTSEEHETNVIARPLVPNLPARPTCKVSFQKSQTTLNQNLVKVNKRNIKIKTDHVYLYPVQVSVCRIRHVIVYNNIDTFNVNPSTNQICSNKNPRMPLLETSITLQPTNKIIRLYTNINCSHDHFTLIE